MAATKSAKNPTPQNDTPNTPKVREGAIAKMKVAELRHKLSGHGVKGTADLKKPELVKQLIKAEVAATKKGTSAKKSAAGKKSAPAKKTTGAKSTGAKKSATATKSAATKKSAVVSKAVPAKRSTKNPTSRNDTPNTPDVSETAIAGLKADELRRKLRGHGVKGTADLKKPELVKQLTKIEVAGAKKKTSGKKSAKAGAGKANG